MRQDLCYEIAIPMTFLRSLFANSIGEMETKVKFSKAIMDASIGKTKGMQDEKIFKTRHASMPNELF